MSHPIHVRLKRAWAAFWCAHPSPTAHEVEIERLINRLRYAAQIKELPMAILDDINTLDTTIAAALAAKDSAAAANVTALATANSTITSLNSELSAADEAVLALNAKYSPAPASTGEMAPVADTPTA